MTLANKITLLRVVLIPLYMTFMYMSGGNAGIWMWIGLAVFIVASITDYIDGHVARNHGQVTDFGKFLDPLADKLLTLSCMTIFCQWGRFPAWALMIVLAREFAVTGLRLVAAGKGSVIAAGKSGKIKTASSMVGLILAMAIPGILWLDWLVVAVIVGTTVYSGVEYFIQNWRCLLD